jgi:hypothetical protein
MFCKEFSFHAKRIKLVLHFNKNGFYGLIPRVVDGSGGKAIKNYDKHIKCTTKA